MLDGILKRNMATTAITNNVSYQLATSDDKAFVVRMLNEFFMPFESTNIALGFTQDTVGLMEVSLQCFAY